MALDILKQSLTQLLHDKGRKIRAMPALEKESQDIMYSQIKRRTSYQSPKKKSQNSEIFIDETAQNSYLDPIMRQ